MLLNATQPTMGLYVMCHINWHLIYFTYCFQCFDAVACWLGGTKGIRPVETECWLDCLSDRGADLHMAQLIPLPLTLSVVPVNPDRFYLFGTSSPG